MHRRELIQLAVERPEPDICIVRVAGCLTRTTASHLLRLLDLLLAPTSSLADAPDAPDAPDARDTPDVPDAPDVPAASDANPGARATGDVVVDLEGVCEFGVSGVDVLRHAGHIAGSEGTRLHVSGLGDREAQLPRKVVAVLTDFHTYNTVEDALAALRHLNAAQQEKADSLPTSPRARMTHPPSEAPAYLEPDRDPEPPGDLPGSGAGGASSHLNGTWTGPNDGTGTVLGLWPRPGATAIADNTTGLSPEAVAAAALEQVRPDLTRRAAMSPPDRPRCPHGATSEATVAAGPRTMLAGAGAVFFPGATPGDDTSVTSAQAPARHTATPLAPVLSEPLAIIGGIA